MTHQFSKQDYRVPGPSPSGRWVYTTLFFSVGSLLGRAVQAHQWADVAMAALAMLSAATLYFRFQRDR